MRDFNFNLTPKIWFKTQSANHTAWCRRSSLVLVLHLGRLLAVEVGPRRPSKQAVCLRTGGGCGDGFFSRDFLISRAVFDKLERAKHWTAIHVAQTTPPRTLVKSILFYFNLTSAPGWGFHFNFSFNYLIVSLIFYFNFKLGPNLKGWRWPWVTRSAVVLLFAIRALCFW